jgi:hypothetical protein
MIMGLDMIKISGNFLANVVQRIAVVISLETISAGE